MNTDHILDILSGALEKQKSHLPPTYQLWKELRWEAVDEGHRSYDPKTPCQPPWFLPFVFEEKHVAHNTGQWDADL